MYGGMFDATTRSSTVVSGSRWNAAQPAFGYARGLAGASEPRDLVEVLAERGGEPVLYAGWEEIDRVEKAAGEPHGRPRVKLHSWDSLLAAARGDKTA